jgi:glycosyltransferase involved in cell wall biosynthesis
VSAVSAPPAVSVLVTCYDLGPYLDEAVQSVLAQSCQDFEILIVDDGSTDPATTRLLADYRRPKTRLIRTDNRGLAAARNLAIARTTGRYLCALDADDTLAPGYFEKAVSILDADPSLTFVSAWVQAFGEETWLWKQDRCDLPALLGECTVMTAALVRREAVTGAGGYDGAMPLQGDEDWDLWLSLVERGHRGMIIPEPLLNYRQRAGSMRRLSEDGAARVEQVRYLVRKHEASYRAHRVDVLLQRDVEVSDLLRLNHELERRIDVELLPRLARLREQRDRLRTATNGAAAPGSAPPSTVDASELAALRASNARLEEALRHAEAEARALRGSWSWTVTAPLRLVYGWLRRLAGRPA